MKKYTSYFLLALALLLITSHSPTRAETNSANVCETINTDTTWLLTSSPYVVCSGGLTVASGATLTIEPGIVVQFESGISNKLNVQGALEAIGTVTQPITFTGLVAAPGSWAGVFVDGTSVTPALANLSYVTLDYGGVSGSDRAQVYADRAVVTITQSLIRNSAGNGVYASMLAQFDAHSTNFVGMARTETLDVPRHSIYRRRSGAD